MLTHRKPKYLQTALLYFAFLVRKLPFACLAPSTSSWGRGSFRISMVSLCLSSHSNKPFKLHSSCTAAMLSVVERLAGCMMYIKEAMYISQCSTCGASLAIVALGCLPACRIPWCVMATVPHTSPWYPYYHSVHQYYKTEFRYIPLVCRVMATSLHRDVHQQYVTEFRYMSSSCQYPSHSITVHTRGHIPLPFTTILLY